LDLKQGTIHHVAGTGEQGIENGPALAAKLSGPKGISVGHIAPEAFVGGPIALLADGDSVRIDTDGRTLEMLVDDGELTRRRTAWTAPEPKYTQGALAKYARTVGSADTGATTW